MSSKKRRQQPHFHVPGRKKRRKRWYERGGDSDCCCIVGEVFDGPCFVATAAHGDAAAEPVRTLRAYRDQRLARTYPGRVFTKAYYRYGRYGARFLRAFPVFKPLVRAALAPLVAYARKRIH
ncbi:hypothetical protein OJ997_33235 [Solirubrobacter phytolaccae]|uniref:Uncharacterized protein n=1 Tax=Solirubrobacter phytolaccae TaxID=1404360 RepID=A0A9X3NKF4_9ACTN|nr:CFI-box-CTERM domain-containing protein [Solirubrobacter phytolaccae]MDA0185216.1 hypothetical protein [Solirubrobacter phytolaccae]